MTKFEAGNSYTHGFACDADAKVTIKIIRRTEKSVWIKHPYRPSEIVRRAIFISAGIESILPNGNYSMAPALSADKQA